ncbi:MAG: hypothetical protein DME75_02670 [Verrucomicrobia bacterium]|nr:MAG: hypothetical protein DME75_02670 [Verrucomicrobiota bacterium]
MITMKTSVIVCICSIALAAGLFAQGPTASPLTTAPAATATVSPASTSESEIEKSIRKKQKRHFNVTIGNHETDADHGKSDGDIPAKVIPIVLITMLAVFGMPVLIVAVIMYFSFSRTRSLQRTVRLMVEKGQPVPEALLNPPPAQRQRSDMRRGVVLVMVGIGLMIFLGAVSDWESGAWSIGLIPFLIGAGYLLVWKLEGKKDSVPPIP